MVSLIAKFVIQEGSVQQAIEAACQLIKDVACEDGTLSYTLNRNPKDPNVLIFMERYLDQAALEVHGKTPYIKHFIEIIMPMLAQAPEITVMEELSSIK